MTPRPATEARVEHDRAQRRTRWRKAF